MLRYASSLFVVLCVLWTGCSDSSTPPPSDSGSGTDSGGGTDSATGTDSAVGSDTGPPPDAPPLSCEMGGDTCPSGTRCLCCPDSPITDHCICTSRCTEEAQCTDPTRPTCNKPDLGIGPDEGICTPAGFTCLWGAMCAAPDTPIATPSGDRPIAQLREGDLVYSVDGSQTVAVPIERVSRTAVENHTVVRVELEGGAILNVSPGHPTADGRTFGDLVAGDRLGEVPIVSAERVPYPHPFTHDILPASDTGDYFAAGARIGSTLR